MSNLILNANYTNSFDQEVVIEDIVDDVVIARWIDQDSIDSIDQDDFIESFSLVSPKTKGIQEPTKRQLEKLLSTNT